MVAELSFYRRSRYHTVRPRPNVYQCQECEEVFSVIGNVTRCPGCFSEDRTNLIVLHAEFDPEIDEMMTKDDFAAGD